MTWLTSLPAVVLVAAGLVLALLATLGGPWQCAPWCWRPSGTLPTTIAAPLMAALGALFALFMDSPWPARPASWPRRKGS